MLVDAFLKVQRLPSPVQQVGFAGDVLHEVADVVSDDRAVLGPALLSGKPLQATEAHLVVVHRFRGEIVVRLDEAVVEPVVVKEGISLAETSDEMEFVVGIVASGGSLAQVAVPTSALPSGSSVKVAAIANNDDLVEQVAVPEGTDMALRFSISDEASDGSDVRVYFAAPVPVEFTIGAELYLLAMTRITSTSPSRTAPGGQRYKMCRL